MLRLFPFCLFILVSLLACNGDPEPNAPKGVVTMLPEEEPTTTATTAELVVHPINHASAVLTYGGKTIHLDPVGGIEPYADHSFPDLILLTDIHGDHLSLKRSNC